MWENFQTKVKTQNIRKMLQFGDKKSKFLDEK